MSNKNSNEAQNKLIPDTEYETVVERVEELHAIRREHEKQMRLISRVERFSNQWDPLDIEWGDQHSRNISIPQNGKKILLREREDLSTLIKEEENPYAENALKHANKLIDLVKSLERLSVSLNKYKDERNEASKAYELYTTSSRSVRQGMRPEKTSDEKFKDMLLVQWEDYCKEDEETRMNKPDGGEGWYWLKSRKEGNKYSKQCKPLLDKWAKKKAEYKSMARTKLYEEEYKKHKEGLHKTHCHLEQEFYVNQDVIMKHRYPNVDIVQHYTNNKLSNASYLEKGFIQGAHNFEPGEWKKHYNEN